MSDTPPPISLHDGRALAYAEWGDPQGAPVFFLHGTPGSRLLGPDGDPVARFLGVRLVTSDRPGYGRSSPKPDATYLDWASDAASLADHLGLRRFAVAGVSGGGPFAAACAYALPDRVVAAALIASSAPLDARGWQRGMAWGNRIGFLASRYGMRPFGWLLRGMMRRTARLILDNTDAYLDAVARRVCASDRELLDDAEIREAVKCEQVEAFRQGIAGVAREMELVGRPWGFDLGAIRVPVHVWHGEADTLAPVAMGRYLARAIPTAIPHFLPRAGHLLTDDRAVWERILRALRDA